MPRHIFAKGLLGAGLVLGATSLGIGLAGQSMAAGPAAASTRSAALSEPGTPPAASQPSPDTQSVKDANGYVSMEVPSTWTVLTPEQLDRQMQDPNMDPALKQYMQTLKQYGALVTLDPQSRQTSPTQFATNVNAYCAPGNASVEALKAAAPENLRQAGAQNIQTVDATVDGHPAVGVKYTLPNRNDQLVARQVQVPVTGRVCVITFTTDRLARYRPIFEAIASTIKLT